MLFIEKDRIDDYRYALGKIAFIRNHRRHKVIRQVNEKTMHMIDDNGIPCYVTLFGKDKRLPSDAKKYSYYLDYKEARGEDSFKLSEEVIRDYESLMKIAFTKPELLLRTLNDRFDECFYTIVKTLDERYVVSGSIDGDIYVRDIKTGDTVMVLRGHEGPVKAISIIPGGRIISSSDDRTLRVWNLKEPEHSVVLSGHKDWVTCVAALPDGRHIVSGSADGTIRVWNVNTLENTWILSAHKGWVTCVAALPDGRHIVSGSTDGMICVWDNFHGMLLWLFEVGKAVNTICILPDGSAFVGCSDRCAYIISMQDAEQEKLRQLPRFDREITTAVASSDGGVIIGDSDGNLYYVDLQSGVSRIYAQKNFSLATKRDSRYGILDDLLIPPSTIAEKYVGVFGYKYRICETVDANKYGVCDGKISFLPPKYMNDPFDSNCVFSNNTDMSQYFKLFCIAPRWDNILMWSYYTDSHKGYCFGYDISMIMKGLSNKTDVNGLVVFGKVMYSKKRPNYQTKTTTFSYTQMKQYIDATFTKYVDWKHEEEQRFVIISTPSSESRKKDGEQKGIAQDSDIIELQVPIASVYSGCNNNKRWNKSSGLKTAGLIPEELKKDPKEYELIIDTNV